MEGRKDDGTDDGTDGWKRKTTQAYLICKSYMCVCLSVATKTRRGPETSEVLKTFKDLNRGVCLSVTTNSVGQGQGGQLKFLKKTKDYLFFLLATVRPD
jgi:hypothetical protein